MKLQAVRNFSGPDGKHAIGDYFEAKAERAKWLVDEGYAVKVEASDDAAPAAEKAPAKRAK